jgi:DNA-binding NtrC family response regulator
MSVLEASYLRTLLGRHRGNVSAAAKAAGIDRKTFHRLLNRHRIRTPRERPDEPGDARSETSEARVT